MLLYNVVSEKDLKLRQVSMCVSVCVCVVCVCVCVCMDLVIFRLKKIVFTYEQIPVILPVFCHFHTKIMLAYSCFIVMWLFSSILVPEELF